MALAALVSLGPRISDFATQAWYQASVASAQASVYWAAAPRVCKDALIFSGNICAGYEPMQYYSSGFGPFPLAWGWLLVGVLVGFLVGLHLWDLLAGLERFSQRGYFEGVRAQSLAACPMRGAPGLHLPPSAPAPQSTPLWHQAACNALAVAPEGPQRNVLRRLVEDGEAALEMLVAATGVTKRTALARVLGESVVSNNALQWLL